MEKTVYYSDKFKISNNSKGFAFNFLKDKDKEMDEVEIDYGFRIGMSPITAKELLYKLFSIVGEYEKENGEIKIEPEMVKGIDRGKTPIGFCVDNK